MMLLLWFWNAGNGLLDIGHWINCNRALWPVPWNLMEMPHEFATHEAKEKNSVPQSLWQIGKPDLNAVFNIFLFVCFFVCWFLFNFLFFVLFLLLFCFCFCFVFCFVSFFFFFAAVFVFCFVLFFFVLFCFVLFFFSEQQTFQIWVGHNFVQYEMWNLILGWRRYKTEHRVKGACCSNLFYCVHHVFSSIFWQLSS